MQLPPSDPDEDLWIEVRMMPFLEQFRYWNCSDFGTVIGIWHVATLFRLGVTTALV